MRKIFIIAAIMLFSAAFVLADEEQAYTNASVARLSFLTGNTYLQRAADLAYEDGQVNAPVTEGDRLGTTDGRVEVALGSANFLRLDLDTKVDFLNLPKKGSTLTGLKIWTGNIYLSLQSLVKEKSCEVHTPDASIYILEKGLFRVDVVEGERTEVLVFEGAVEVAGQEGSNILSDGQKIEVARGRFLSRPTRLVASADDTFDEWNTDREAMARKTLSSHYLPEDLWEYEYELDQYGDWRDMSPYGHVWIPRGVGSDWRPYHYGRWTWIPFCGWTWVGYDPWGWAPFHYGRWQWDPWYGWYWIPTNIWGPAWVSWWWGWDYYGWAPLGWYGYPGVILHNRYYDHHYGDYPHDSRAWTVIHKNQLKAPDVSKVVVNADRLKSVEKISMTTDAHLAPRPEISRAVSIEKLNNGRVFLRTTTGSGASEERVIRGRTSTSTSGGQDSGQGTVIHRRDSGQGQTSGESQGQDSGRSTRRVIERTSRDTGSKTSGQEQGTSQGSSQERRIRKKDDDQDSSASGASVSNGTSGATSSYYRSSQGYSSRSTSITNQIFRYGTSRPSTTLGSSWRGSSSRSFSSSISTSRSSSGSHSSSSSRSSSGSSHSSSSGSRRKN